ncbi:McrC family protein [Larsenimonas rhizosphaerae]|uniref:McrC family protein n=1 Tax=Larsenimonas rhizosphaerae TaxID=2944682 RepID=UPI0020347378|nr:McrC family protein [Larsenimonas rhizosphaerae]
MTTRITVREYARLTTEPIDNPGLDRAHVSVTVFDWLCQLNESFGRGGASLIQVEGRRWLRLDNYVGVLEAPCGTCLEILPKHFESTDDIAQGRRLLRRMIQAALDLPTREVGTAALELFDAPLSEWVMRQFLEALEHVVKRGVRFDYRRVEEEQPFLRGQLDVVGQMRQPPGKQHHFRIRHDLFGPNRPENRLLKLALERVCKSTQVSSSWRLAHELRGMLSEVPASHDPRQDFRAWRTDRLMAHYQAVRPWCQLMLDQTMPIAVAGQQYGMSLLFPMEQLFEQYVARYLERTKSSDTRLKMQAASAWLCRHEGGNFFQLRPDLLLSQGNRCWVLDTKWKRLNAESRNRNYGLSQADFYQLFAYGHKYLKGQGDVVLIYPAHTVFNEPLEVFEFSPQMKLWVLPFDLERNCLIGAETAGLPVSNRRQFPH